MIASALVAAVTGSTALVPLRVQAGPAVDGELDDAAWHDAPVSSAFTQKLPTEGTQPVDGTSVKVVYDDDAVYIAIDCPQSAPVVGRLTRRDGEIEADYVAIDLDTRRDGRTAFHFQVNAAGVLVDGVRFDDTEMSLDWDENWEAATHVSHGGWSAEIRIPLRVLRFGRATEQVWGAQIRRYVSSRQELDEWTFIPRQTAGEVSRYGRIGPFDRLDTGTAIELRPFALGRVRIGDPATSDDTSIDGSAGVDAKWHLTEDLTLDLAVLPDFGQVEADQLVLNLSSFETFFPEKRPFFVEGADLFATPLQLVYTRRIGRQPGDPALADGEELIASASPAAIYGAGKLVGRIGPLELAALTAVTGKETARAGTMDGDGIDRVADPTSMYSAVRVRAPLGASSYVGVTGGSTLRFESAGDYPEVADPETGAMQILCPTGTTQPLSGDCFHDAHVAGVDALWRSDAAGVVVSAQAVGSVVQGGPPRELADGTTIGSGDIGYGSMVRAAKEGGNWIGELSYEMESRHLDLNDLGFLTQQNLHRIWFAAAHRTTAPWRFLLEHRAQLEIFHRRNWDGLMLPSGYQINSSGRFRNFWGYFVELHYRPAYFDDREIGNGVALERAGVLGLEAEAETDPRYPVAGGIATTTQLLDGVFVFDGSASVHFRIVPELDLSVEPGFSHRSGEPRFIEAVGPSGYLFGRLRATSASATLRSTYTFTPRLTFQLFAQAFLASLHYSDFLEYTGAARQIRQSDLDAAMPPATSADSAEAALNATAVLRWEYRLGSTLFVVYSRAQAPEVALGASPASLPWTSLARGSSADVFLVKLSYWWH